MYGYVILENVITLLGINIRPCIKLDSEAIGDATISQVFAVFFKDVIKKFMKQY